MTVEEAPWEPDELSPLAARVILTQKSSWGRSRTVPVLAFTLVPVVTFREIGGELTSALVSALLSQGFQLAMSPDYSVILQQARQTPVHCRFTLTPWKLLQLSIADEILFREQLDPETADDVEWLEAAERAGEILVISGDNLHITGKGLDVRTAARQGTLVIGAVTYESVRAGNPVSG